MPLAPSLLGIFVHAHELLYLYPSYLWGASGVYSVRQAQTRALQGVYLEVGCVHVCTLWYTHVYTMVYLRVYSSPLVSRYTRDASIPRTPILQPHLWTPQLHSTPSLSLTSSVSPIKAGHTCVASGRYTLSSHSSALGTPQERTRW